MIDDKTINEIIDKTDIVGLVGEYVKLTKRGKNYFGLCPFHDDSNPSFSVSPEKKIAKCMTCGEGGNPINFLRKIKNISFNDACFELANRVGIKLDIAKTNKKVDHNYKYYEINQIAMDFYAHFLFHSQSGKEALNYLYKRGLSDETIKMFEIGLAPKDKDSLYKLLNSKGYADFDIADIGLAKNGHDGYYDMFTNRIMFPIIDEEGHTIGFSGRIYDNNSSNEPKYVNTTETPIYHKGEKLFNLNNAIMYARKKKRLILCEGQMDAISVYNAGLKEVIASLGTALTVNQINLIKRYTNEIIIMYDGDNAGINAIEKAFKLLKGINAKAVILPDGMDPDEYIKANGKDSLESYINSNLLDYYEFSYRFAFKDRNLSNAYDYEQIKRDVFSFLKNANSYALIEKYLIRLSVDLKVSYDAIYSDYSLYSTNTYKAKNVEIVEEEKNHSTKLAPYERMFIVLSIIDKKHFDYINRELDGVEKYLMSDEAINLYVAMSYFFNSGSYDSLMLLKYLKQETGLEVVNEFYNDITMVSSYNEEKIEKIKNDCIKRFKMVLFQEKRKSFVVSTNDASEQALNTMSQKLEYVRNNIKTGKMR